MKQINDDVYLKELGMCKRLEKEKAGCHWGKCSECGVFALLYKLNKGIVLESKEEIEKKKKRNILKLTIKFYLTYR